MATFHEPMKSREISDVRGLGMASIQKDGEVKIDKFEGLLFF